MRFASSMSFTLGLLICVISLQSLDGQLIEDDGPYQGKYIGKLNSYHHQVAGDVYAVDEFTLLIKSFSYDGNGADTFFWAGAANRPGPQGFIVPDEYGITNVLDRYLDKDFTLTLPDGKKLTEIKWFAIYDLSNQNTFGDVYIPEEFEPPLPQKATSFNGYSHKVSSDTIVIVDSKTIRIPEFSYDGLGKNTYFWVGVGPQPSSKGTKVPDEFGYLDILRAYDKETIMLELPGDITIFNVDWLSIFDLDTKENFGSILIPDGLNVPPSLVKVEPHKNTLPNCVQLHKDLQVSWEVFGPQVTIQLAGQITEDEYMSFGISGSSNKTQMLNSDVTVAYIEGFQGFAIDYSISALAPCIQVLGQYKGVCKDTLVGGQDNNQFHTSSRENGISKITYRRTLISSDSGDKEYLTEGSLFIVWAMGKLDHNKEPGFHDFYPKRDVKLEFGVKEPIRTCFDFTRSDILLREPWEKSEIFDRNIRTFTATVGPAGGKRGYQGLTGQTTNGLSWYINGLMAPELWLRRGLTYAFKVYGGNNPHSAEWYHPLIISVDPHGGFDRLSDAAQKNIKVLAGVEFTRRGRPRPTAVGPLCSSTHQKGRDRRLDDDFPTFKKFNRSLEYKCEPGEPALLEITPNSSWPDVVYYNSFTHSNMGWRIHVVDQYTKSSSSHVYFCISLLLFIPMLKIIELMRL